MAIKIGIPRALYYHKFYPLWHTFFTELGAEVLLSPVTDKIILKCGSDATLDEFCLPIKVFFGHINAILKKADFLFIPRLISTEREAYYCPQFFGLPDMVRVAFPDSPPILEPTFNAKGKGTAIEGAFIEVGKSIFKGRSESLSAYRKAVDAQARFYSMVAEGIIPPAAYKKLFNSQLTTVNKERVDNRNGSQTAIALLGHPYNIYDPIVSMNIIKKLMERGIRLITTEMVSDDIIDAEMKRLRKPVYWASGREIVGAANHFLNSKSLDGIIFIGAFHCGPDSLLKALIEREAQNGDKTPLLSLSFDEHSGEAGMITRLEAFLDMLEMKKRRGATAS